MRASLLFIFLVSLSTVATLSSLGQTPITVFSNEDSGPGSLREAIDSLAAPGDIIVFHPDLSGDTIRFDSGRIQIQKT